MLVQQTIAASGPTAWASKLLSNMQGDLIEVCTCNILTYTVDIWAKIDYVYMNHVILSFPVTDLGTIEQPYHLHVLLMSMH